MRLIATPHPAYPLPADIGCEHRTKTVPPVPHRLLAHVNAALGQQALEVAQGQREPGIHGDHEPDPLLRGVEVFAQARRLDSRLAWMRDKAAALQKFASIHANVHKHFSLQCLLVDRQAYKARRSAALAEGQNFMA